MKGITPVITTVLLLLMAVAAVGGAWVWYQRMQMSSMAGGAGQVEQLRKTAVSISTDKLECNSTGQYYLIMANVGTESVTLTEMVVANSAGTSQGSTTGSSLPANVLTGVGIANSSVGTACSSGTTYYISARIGAQYIIRGYPVTSET